MKNGPHPEPFILSVSKDEGRGPASPQGAVTTNCLSPTSVRPAFHLDACAEDELMRTDRRAGGVAAGIEVRRVDLVERSPFGHVGKIDDRLEDMLEAETAFLQNALDVLHHLPAFGFDAAGDERHLAGRISDRAGQVDDVAGSHGLTEGQIGRFCRARINEGQHVEFPRLCVLAIVTSRLHGRNVPESTERLERRGNLKAGH